MLEHSLYRAFQNMTMFCLRLVRELALVILACYRGLISPYLGAECCYYPSCSTYASHAFKHHPLWYACWLTLSRLLRCHPWGKGGYDPIPPISLKKSVKACLAIITCTYFQPAAAATTGGPLFRIAPCISLTNTTLESDFPPYLMGAAFDAGLGASFGCRAERFLAPHLSLSIAANYLLHTSKSYPLHNLAARNYTRHYAHYIAFPLTFRGYWEKQPQGWYGLIGLQLNCLLLAQEQCEIIVANNALTLRNRFLPSGCLGGGCVFNTHWILEIQYQHMPLGLYHFGHVANVYPHAIHLTLACDLNRIKKIRIRMPFRRKS